MWQWIIAQCVDGKSTAEKAPAWFVLKRYRQLLRWLYVWVPLAVVGVGGAALTLALAVSSWQTAVLAAAAFAVVLYLGRRLIDLAAWWRQVQRQEGEGARERKPKQEDANSDERERSARGFRSRARAWPVAMGLAGAAGVWLTASELCQRNGAELLDATLRWALVAGVTAAVLAFTSRGRLPSAYRTSSSGEGGLGAELVAGLFGVVSLGLGVVAGVVAGVKRPAAGELPGRRRRRCRESHDPGCARERCLGLPVAALSDREENGTPQAWHRRLCQVRGATRRDFGGG